MFLGEVDEPVVAMAILAWTLLALAGSVGGVLRGRKSTHAKARHEEAQRFQRGLRLKAVAHPLACPRFPHWA